MNYATTIRQYIEQWCGWDAKTSRESGDTDDDIRTYFSRENFASMFGEYDAEPDEHWTFKKLANEAIDMAHDLNAPDKECDRTSESGIETE